MGNNVSSWLLEGVDKVLRRRKHIVIVGMNGTGKTTVLCQLMNSPNHPNECICAKPKRGDQNKEIIYKSERFRFKEVGGRNLGKQLIKKNDAKDGIIFVVDGTDNRRANLDILKPKLLEIIEEHKVTRVLVLVNKRDHPASMSGHTINDKLWLKYDAFRKFDWKIKSVSALKGKGVSAESLAWFNNNLQTNRRAKTA